MFFEEKGFDLGLFGSDTRNEEFSDVELLWSEALYTEFFGCEVIEIQITNRAAGTYDPDDPIISGMDPGDVPPINTVIHLIAGLDSLDNISYRLIHIVPAEGFLESKGISRAKFMKSFRLWDTADDYSGAIHIYGVEGEYVKGFEITDGCIKHGVIPKESGCHEDCLSGDECSCEGDSDEIVVIMFVLPPPGPDGIPYSDEDQTPVVVQGNITKDVFKFDWSIYDYVDPFGGSGGGGGWDPGPDGGGGSSSDKCAVCQKKPCECCTVCKKMVCECKQAEPTDPCENLMNKLKDPAYKGLLDWLKKEGVSLTYESGRFSTYSGDTFGISSIDGEPGEPGIYFGANDIPQYATSFIHCHYAGLLKTFSPDDLYVPYQLYMAGKGVHLPSFSFGVVTPDGNVYFLFVHDINKYLAFWNKMGEVGVNMIDRRYKEKGINVDLNDSKSAEGLLKVLKELDLGMTLMKMNDFGTGFKEMSLKPLGGVKEVECRTL